MALPVGVTTATCTVGVPVSFTGAANIRANVSVKPSVFLVHAETGTPLVDMLETIDTTDGVAGQFTLPHTDQAGFVDENQNTYTNWFYTVTIQYSNERHVMLPKTKVFQLTTGQTLVDLDKLPSGVPALPYTAPVATVTSVVGLTGPVTGAHIAADPALTATILDQIETEGVSFYAPVADTLRLRNLTDLAASDRQKSSAQSRIAYEDALNFQEAWTNLTAWSSGTAVQVSGGLMYSAAQGAGSGINHSFALAGTDSLRAVFVLNYVSGLASGGVIIGVSKAAAGAAPAAGGGDMRGLYFSSAGVQSMNNGAATFIGTQSTTATFIVTLEVDANYISVIAVSTDGVTEWRSRFIRSDFTVNNIALFNSDARQLTGLSVGKLGARKGNATNTPRTDIEGLARTVNWTSIGNSAVRVALPANYDSRKPSPVVMLFHGNGSDENHWQTNGNGKAVAEAFVAAGYIAVAAANTPNVSTWGAQAGLDAYYNAYKYVRDRYNIGPVVFYGNSMGGLESLLTLAERRVPGVVAWLGTVPVTNLAANHTGALNAALFTATIRTAYGIAGDGSDYAAKTAGHDPALKAGTAFRGVPMWVLVATDDVAVIPSENFNVLEPIVSPFATELVRINATGGHSTGSIASNAAAMVTFANKYVTG